MALETNDKIDALDRKIDKILTLLDGDNFNEGLIKSVKDHEGRIVKIESRAKKAAWMIGGASAAAGMSFSEIIKKIASNL